MRRKPGGIPEGGEFASNSHDQPGALIVPFPAAGRIERIWDDEGNYGSRRERGRYFESVPALIADVDPILDRET